MDLYCRINKIIPMPQLDTIMYSSIILFLWVFLLIFTEVLFLYIKYLYNIMRTKTLYIRNLYYISIKTFKQTNDLNKQTINQSTEVVKQLSHYMNRRKVSLKK